MIDRLPPIPIVFDGVNVDVVFEVYQDNGEAVCGLYSLDGTIGLKPKAWLRTVRAHVAQFEDIARAAGCVELRIAGRDWSRVLPDYEPLPGGKPNRIRKRLD